MFQNLRKILRSTNFKISDLVIDFEVSNRDFEAKVCSTHRNFYPHCGENRTNITLVTQPMLQLRPNCTELRSMDYYHQILCRFRKCKQKVPPPSLLSNNFEKSCFSSAIFSNDFFSKLTFLNSR